MLFNDCENIMDQLLLSSDLAVAEYLFRGISNFLLRVIFQKSLLFLAMNRSGRYFLEADRYRKNYSAIGHQMVYKFPEK